jgi:hypothetical protein
MTSPSTDCLVSPTISPRPTGVSPDGLEAIHQEDVGLVCWARRLPAGTEEELANWARRSPAAYDEVVPKHRYDLSAATAGVGSPVREWLTRDLSLLVARFMDVTQSTRVRVSFGAVRTDQCRKFHVDYVRFRLITTYSGLGTQWVVEEGVRRDALGRPVEDPHVANEQIVRREEDVRHARPGEVLLMKGALHPCRRGVVHRSPPIEGSRRPRVVLAISTVNAE